MQLRIPGPTPCPDEVLQSMTKQMIGHRSKGYQDLNLRVTEKLKEVFQTQGDVLILTAAGTGGLEAAAVNTLSPGDKVLSVTIGVFGDRFADIAEQYGADGYAKSAGTAVDEAINLLKMLKKEMGSS